MKRIILILSILFVSFAHAYRGYDEAIIDFHTNAGLDPTVIQDLPVEELSDGLDNTMNKIHDRFENAVLPWTARMKDVAEKIFFMLIGLDFAWMCIKFLLNDSHISQTMRELMKKVFLYGFGYYLVSYGNEMLVHIFRFFQDSSATTANSSGATSGTTDISNFFDSSMGVINDLYISLRTDEHSSGVISGFMSGVGKVLLIIGLLYLIVYISTKVIVAYAEMYITITATIVLFGFFVSDWTREIAQRSIMHTISMGFKFFTTLLIARIGITAVEQWLAVSNDQSFINSLAMMGVILVFALLLAVLPTAMASIVSLTSVFSPGDQVASSLNSISNQLFIKNPMGQIGAAGVAGSLAVTKAAEAGKPIAMMGGGMKGAASSAGRLAAGTAKNLVRAYKDAATNLFTGKDREMQARGSLGQQMSYQMYQRQQDSQFRKDQKDKQSGGGAKGKSDTATTKKASASDDEDSTI